MEITQVLPHRPPMLLVDELVECRGDHVKAVKTFRDGDYGVVDGVVAEAFLIECLAQTLAALRGYNARLKGLEPLFGMLVGVDNFTVHESAKAGEELEMSGVVTRELGSFCLSEGTVCVEGRLLAEGALKFYEEERAGEE